MTKEQKIKIIETCAWCLEAQVMGLSLEDIEGEGWQYDEDDRAYCPSCLKWLDGGNR